MRRECGKADTFVNSAFLIKDSFAQTIEAEPAATLPADRSRNSTLFTVNHLLQARHAMGHSMFTHFNTDIAPPHFVGNSSRGAGAKEGVQDEVAGVGSDMEDTLNECFRLWSAKHIVTKKNNGLFFGILCMAYVFIRPVSLWYYTLFYVT